MSLSRNDTIARALEATAWLEHGESLLAAARELAAHLAVKPLARTEATRLAALGAVRGTMTLMGAGIECLLKALAVSQAKLEAVDPKIRFSPGLRGSYNHDLVLLAGELNFGLSAEEADVVQRASCFLVWAGRYPIARTMQATLDAISQGTLRFSPADVDVSDGVAARIRTIVAGTA